MEVGIRFERLRRLDLLEEGLMGLGLNLVGSGNTYCATKISKRPSIVIVEAPYLCSRRRMDRSMRHRGLTRMRPSCG